VGREERALINPSVKLWTEESQRDASIEEAIEEYYARWVHVPRENHTGADDGSIRWIVPHRIARLRQVNHWQGESDDAKR